MRLVRYSLSEFLVASPESVMGQLSYLYADLGFASLWASAIDAWRQQIPILRDAVQMLVASRPDALDWHLLLEYEIPMRDRRPDAVIVADTAVFVLEFKVGAASYDSVAQWQAQSYALDLRDFHPACRDRIIVPILVATDVPDDQFSQRDRPTRLREPTLPVQLTNRRTLGPCLSHNAACYCSTDSLAVNMESWESAKYSPVPNIIEAAKNLFSKHTVADITHAFSDSLETATSAIVNAIDDSRKMQSHSICFVTGIPGSGKTLIGLNAVHHPTLLQDNRSSAMYLSGNSPLVKVIRQALAEEQQIHGITYKEAMGVATALIGNVHAFIKLNGMKKRKQAPIQNAIIFDEAQRAWNAMAVKKKHKIRRSEPDLILDIMELAPWATIIALVGGGQEIHAGEAGLAEWGKALRRRRTNWRVLVSPEVVSGGESVAGHRLFSGKIPKNITLVSNQDLHLSVNVRSHRARFIGEWVNRTLSNRPVHETEPQPGGDFPVMITRDLEQARKWLKDRNERCQRVGLLASSGAVRLRAFGLELSSSFRKGVSFPHWFLRPSDDVRSSYQLEVAASEFECQGLELDWAGVCWGGDLVVDPSSGAWSYWRFKGTNWDPVDDATARQYVTNKYRVLLTRARRGMIIWVPPGSSAAHTSESLNATAKRLQNAGVRSID